MLNVKQININVHSPVKCVISLTGSGPSLLKKILYVINIKGIRLKIKTLGLKYLNINNISLNPYQNINWLLDHHNH